MICLFFPVNFVNEIYWVSNGKPILHSWNKHNSGYNPFYIIEFDNVDMLSDINILSNIVLT